MDFYNELDKLLKLPLEETQNLEFGHNSLSEAYEDMTKQVKRFKLDQQELNLQIEELYSVIVEKEEENPLINALIELMDYIENFYYFAQSSSDLPLMEQAQLMWRGAVKKATLAGLVIIQDADIKTDSQLHHIVLTSYDENKPEGVIIKTLKSGYIYEGKVLRKSEVVVNSASQSK